MTLKQKNDIHSQTLLEEDFIMLKGLKNDLFKPFSEKAFKEAEEVTYKLIEEDNENPYL